MTLRPFKIISIKGNTEYGIYNHRGNKICPSQRLHKQFYKKLLSYPITAFGYELGIYVADKFKRINPKFDKKDIIKALDFWIEYFVYQNKCDYILENTVNKDFELHLEELIMVREAVLKNPADTKYVRQKIRPKFHIQDVKKKQKMMVEFTENVLDVSNSPFSTVDQFCYKVKTMTRKEYKEYNKPKLYSKDLAQIALSDGNLSRMITALMERQGQLAWEEAMNQVPVPTGELARNVRAARFGDPEDEISFTMWGAAHSGGGSVQERHPLNPDNWVIIPDRASEDTFKIVNSINGLNIATDFRTEAEARSYIEGIRNR